MFENKALMVFSFLLSFTIIFGVCLPNCAHAKKQVATYDATCEYFYGSITGPDKCWCAKPQPDEYVGGHETFTSVPKKLCKEWMIYSSGAMKSE